MAMHGRCRMVHSGLRHVTAGVEARITMAVSTLVGNEYLRVCIVEMPSVIVGVHSERPAASLPCHRAIEVCHFPEKIIGKSPHIDFYSYL